MSDSGDFYSYYLRRIGVVPEIAEALSRKGQGLSVFTQQHEKQSDASGPTVLPHHTDIQPLATREAAPSIVPDASSTPVANDLPEYLADLCQAASVCTACSLSAGRNQVVFGVGSESPHVLFIGEAPGAQEDLQGEPFVGPAGQLLDQMLAALGWSRDNVYIMNVIKCRPPGNRDPRPDEITACSHWFDAQWALLKPKVVCLLGRVAAQRVLGTDLPLSALRGRWHEYRGVPVWVTYHPAYLLRSPSSKVVAWKDFRLLAGRVRGLKD